MRVATRRHAGAILLALTAALVFPQAASAASSPEVQARQIVEATGITGGLIVHLGCGDGRLTTALRTGDTLLVHGLDADPANVARARACIRSTGLYGPVSVNRFDGRRLPYAENLVNLVVAEALGNVPMAEVLRVIAPGGVAWVGGTKTVKPHPGNTDEWTHYLHDASGNPVAHDAVVGPPRRVQWIAGPRHTRSHEHTPSINALVSSAGRIFYVADHGPVTWVRQPADWRLMARDAYNGLLLWERSFRPWFPHIVNWGQTPRHLQRRLVAAKERLYVTLGLHAPLSVLDAATGKTLKVYDDTEGTEEVLYHEGVLLLVVRSVTDDRANELKRWHELEQQRKSPLYKRESAEPLVQRFRKIESGAARTIRAIDAATGRPLWQVPSAEVGGLRPDTLCAQGDRVLYQRSKDVRCLDLKTGRQRWSAPAPTLWAVHGDRVVCADAKTVTVLAADTGKRLWVEPTTLCQLRDVFVAGGSLWIGGFKPWQGRSSGKRGPAWGPYFATQRNLETGKILSRVEPECPGHHHRCWRNKATDRYILGGRRGVEFIDLATGDYLWHSWVRGVCRYGVMPSNGLLYAPPHACGCYIAAKLEGFHALTSGSPGRPAPSPEAARMEQGPAYGVGPQAAGRTSAAEAWPTYRHDAARSGATLTAVPAALEPAWVADVGGTPTAPTVAGGKVFVASVDQHTVAALDADSGAPAWHFTARARIDSPPTLHDGRAVFGCRDGCVYSLRASDGALAWRRQMDRAGRLVVACGQLESVCPVPGSVLVRDGAVYTAAGRSSYLDGGMDLCRLAFDTGKILSVTPIYSPDPETGRQPDHDGPCYMPGVLGEILSSDGPYVYLRDAVYGLAGTSQPAGNPHLFALTGFLDDSWPHRSYWAYGRRCSIRTGCSGRDKDIVSGRLLVVGASRLFGYGRARLDWSNQLQDGPYRLFAVKRGETKEAWTKPMPITVRALVLAGKVLFAAGPPVTDGSAPAGQGTVPPALLLAYSAADGRELARCPLEGPPVFDGMAATTGRLYVATTDGKVRCFVGK